MPNPPAPSPPPAPFPGPAARLPRWLLGVVLAVATAVFLPSLAGGFLGDDFVYIVRFRELPWSAWPPLFYHDWSGGVWSSPLRELRPFAALSFMTDAKLFGGWAPGYQLTNLLLHLVSVALVTRLAWRYSAGRVGGALTAGLVFALHPAHAEAVIWITGRVDLLATAAGLLFWYGAEQYSDHGRRGCLAITLGAFFLGVFSKELVMFAPLLLLLCWLVLGLRAPRAVWLRRAGIFAGVLVIFGGYAIARRIAFGQDHIGYSLWSEPDPWTRQASHFGWFFPVLPFTGRAEWLKAPPLATLHAIWLVLAGLTVAGLAVTLVRRARLAAAAVFFGGVWYFVTVFPLLGVIYFSPRHLYFPTIGLALGVGLLVAALRHAGARTIVATAFISWCGLAFIPASRPWRESAAISRRTLAVIDGHLATAPAGTIVATRVPDTFEGAWLWAWSSPECYRAPFLAHPQPTTRVIEHAVNYTRTDTWAADRKPVERLRAAPAAVVVYVSPDGRISSRVVAPPELAAAADRLAAAGVSMDSWDACVKSLAAAAP